MHKREYLIAILLALCSLAGTLSADPVNSQAMARIYNTSGQCAGTGTLVGKDATSGLVLSCGHLFNEGRTGIVITFPDGERFNGTLVALDKVNDVSFIAIAPPKVDPAPLGVDLPPLGSTLYAAGFGPSNVNTLLVSAGRYTARVHFGDHRLDYGMKIEGSVRAGDSGGPIFNGEGEVVGVIAACDAAIGQAPVGRKALYVERSDGVPGVYGPNCKRINAVLTQCPNGVCQPFRIFRRPQRQPPNQQPRPGPEQFGGDAQQPPVIPGGQQGPPGPLPGPAPEQPGLAPGPPAGALEALRARLEQQFAAEKERLLADAEEKTQERIQAAAKDLRAKLAARVGISPAVQSRLDDLAEQLESKTAELAKQSGVVERLANDLKVRNAQLANQSPVFAQLQKDFDNKSGQLADLQDKHKGLLAEHDALKSQLAVALPRLSGLPELQADLANVRARLHDAEPLAAQALDWKGRLDLLAPELAALKASLPAQLGPLATMILPLVGGATGPAGWVATGITILASLAAGWFAKGKVRGNTAAAAIAAMPFQGMQQPIEINTSAPSPQVHATRQNFYPVETPTINEIAREQALKLWGQQNPGDVDKLNMLQSWTDQLKAGMQKGRGI